MGRKRRWERPERKSSRNKIEKSRDPIGRYQKVGKHKVRLLSLFLSSQKVGRYAVMFRSLSIINCHHREVGGGNGKEHRIEYAISDQLTLGFIQQHNVMGDDAIGTQCNT